MSSLVDIHLPWLIRRQLRNLCRHRSSSDQSVFLMFLYDNVRIQMTARSFRRFNNVPSDCRS